MARDLRQSSERLGFLMNSTAYEGLTEDLKQFLQRTGLPMEKVINHPIQRYNGRTPVHLAASNGLWECLEILLKNGGNPNAASSPTDLCQTALHLAATKGYAKCLQILLEHGAIMDTENIHRVTALDLVRGKKQCEKVFQHAIARVQIPPRTREQQQRVVELHQLVEDTENLVEFYHQYETLPVDHMDLATRWTDWYQQTLLYRACAVECFDIVQFLLTKSENQPLHNFNTEDTPLHVVCKKSNHVIAEVLLKHSPRMLFLQDARRLTPLHIACSRGDVRMVQLILDTFQYMLSSGEYTEDNQLTLDFRDALGRTPFFNACYYGFTEIVRMLVRFQAENSMLVSMNVNAALSNTQRTPLHAAVRKGSTDILQLLLTLKDITIDAEARPSDKTHKRIIHILQKKLHGRVIPGQDSVDDDRPTSSPTTSNPSTPVFGRSTPATRNTPPTLTSPSSSGALDEGLGRYMRSPTRRTPTHERHATVTTVERERWAADEPRSPIERNAFTITFPRPLPRSGGDIGMEEMKKRATTDAPGLGLGDTTIGVFELRPNGKLEVKPLNQGTMLKGFKDFFVTPLAEACAYGYVEIISLLLKYGAQDETGLACRIAHLVQRPDLVGLILSHHCFMGERRTDLRKTPNSTFGLQLLWSNKNLPCVDGEWLKGRTIYYPPSHGEDDEGGDTGYSSTMIVQQQRQRRLSSRAEVNTTAITVIHLEQNSLDSVPIELFHLPNVIELDLSNNNLTKLPESQGYDSWECVQLEELNLNRNSLVKLPSCIWTLPGLIKLSVSHNKLESLLPDRGREINDEMLSLTLESIDFSHNQLKVLPRFVFELQSLKRVTLHHNSLDALPETLWSCITLQELIVSNNLLTSLPWCEPEHTMIASRTEAGTGHPDLIRQSERALTGTVEVRPLFDRNSSFFKRQPSHMTLQGIRPLGTVQELSWSNYSAAGTEGCDYSSLYKLNVSNNKLDTFPEALPCLAPNLTEIDVSKNTFKHIDIQFIPQSIKKFTAKHCQIERFGNIIGKDLYLQVVKNCRHGKTFGLPCQHRSHPRLPCLTTLNLVGNQIQYFQLIHHPPLDEETQDHRKDESKFQVKVSSLELLYPALEGLDLTSNNLQEEFNPNIGHQSHLKWIRLSKNHDLLKVPMEFAYLKNTRQFTELSMEDLPNLWEPPKDYQSVSLTHLLTYMRSRLKESVYYRTIKLFFIGDGERGKTTLLRRLRSLPDEKTDRTTGIDIEDWYYPDNKKLFNFGRTQRTPVHFIAWDFAGQGVYHTTHQCFYSRRSLYIALFRLTDGMKGVNELEPWLRNVQLRAPGCPVILVGTRLDQVSEQSARELEKAAFDKYDDPAIYPKVINVVGVSSTRRASVFFNNNLEKLRNLIYDVACHLQLSTDGSTLEYKHDMPENDPKALFQQQIPKNFLSLQDSIREVVAAYVVRGTPPIMEEDIFKETFKDIFEDEDELNEAVFCLNLQGTLLHFDDHALKNVYFLDPQWLAKLMADVIHPSAEEEGSPIRNGVGEISQLFKHHNIPPGLKKKYIHLLEKFEVALKIDCRHVIIPSLMPGSALYPKTTDVLSDVTSSLSPSCVDCYYQPALRRFWLSNYIPDGFWPRLICRIATDQKIGKLLLTVIGDDTNFENGTRCDEEGLQDQENIKWIPWKSGIAFAHRGKTLLVVKQESNLRDGGDDLRLNWLEGIYRVEVHVYTPEWVALATELLECDRINYSLDAIPGLATKLLVMISQHIKSLASDWFPGMLTSYYGHPSKFSTYMPCWKCFAEIGTAGLRDDVTQLLLGVYISKNQNPVNCFIFEDNIVPAAQQKELDCPLHNKIKVEHMAPDLIFSDLQQQSTDHQGTEMPLRICEDEVLGKGGYGFVCKGELTQERGLKKNVAVKVFLQEIEGLVEQSSIAELLERSKQSRHILYAYKEIRQEVAFLSTLDHPNLTELCGVRTHPYMCLLLELAPKGSLRTMLKEYKECNLVLEPLTLKATTMQIASGLEYLHRHQVAHLDMKSPNVLVWHFPSPHDSRHQRLRQAGNVLLKIADYGISQVSTAFTIRVGNSPVGTPGFMAPELFDHGGQEVSSEKVDVFAFGMTLYELLSLKSPFDLIKPHVKRNHEVKEKKRPILKAKETRSLVLLQDIMTMCWDHEPDDRPRMEQVKEWASLAEFERLRAQISLRDVNSISCACVCRITPDNEGEQRNGGMGLIPEEDEVDDEDYCGSPLMDDLMLNGPFDPDTHNLSFEVRRDILPSVSDDNSHVEHHDAEETNGEENVYQFQLKPAHRSSVVAEDGGDLHEQILEPYTQIWLCGRDQRKGLLQIFTYYDGQPGSYSFSGYCSKDEVSAICAVRNTMWLGTTSGTLKVFHAPTLKAKFAGKLEVDGSGASPILDILHVEETASVLVATVGGDIWSFYDRLLPGGLRIQDRIILPDMNPCYHLVKVNVDNCVEVWGTLDNNRVLLLEKDGMGWRKLEFQSDPHDSKLRLCSYIAHACFTSRSGTPQNHVWISYRHRSVLVCWDARNRQQRCILNCAEKLRHADDVTFQVATLTAHGRKIFVGTTSGTVGVFDSESLQLLNVFSWHKGKVRTLLIMPKEMEPCVCAEIPYGGKEEDTSNEGSRKHTHRFTGLQPPVKPRTGESFSFMNNKMFIRNSEPDAVLVTSIGNGRKRFLMNEPTKAEKVKMFDRAALITVRRPGEDSHRIGEDVCLLSWKS